jgi:glycosyltransferase involved in cell wall biosynthesis
MIMGGVEKALLSLLDVLKDKDVSVTLLLLRDGGELYNQIPDWVNVEILEGYKENQYLIIDNPMKVAIRYFKERNYVDALQALIRTFAIKSSKKNKWYLNYETLLKKLPNVYQTKVAISFRGLDYFVPYYVLEKIKAKHKLVWIDGDVKYHIFEDNIIAGKLFPQFDRIYSVSDHVKKSFDEMFPALVKMSAVFRNLVPDKKLKAMGSESLGFQDDFAGVKILTVGRLSALKGQDRIPAVAKRLISLNIPFRWYLVGDGELRPQIEKLILKYGVQERVLLLGNKMNPYPYLKECDLYVQTSHTEGCSIVMHEAKIFKRPIVTTDVASAALIVEDHIDGLIVPNNEEGLFNGVREMLLNPEKRKSFEKFELENAQGDDSLNDLLRMSKE